jgi:hypothetical protein
MMRALALSIFSAAGLLAAQPRSAPVPFWTHLAGATDLMTDSGSTLLLLLVDVNGDGQREIFIAPEALCGNGGCEWSVYTSATGPREVRYLGQAVFPNGQFRMDAGRHTLVFCSHLSAESCALGEYAFSDRALQRRDLGTCRSGDRSCEEQLAQIRAWQSANPPPVFETAIVTDDSLLQLQWRPFQRGSKNASSSVPDLDRLVVTSPR